MTVEQICANCYDTIVIYRNPDDDMLDFIDLYKGSKENIPRNLLNKEVRCFGAKRKGVIDISIRN